MTTQSETLDTQPRLRLTDLDHIQLEATGSKDIKLLLEQEEKQLIDCHLQDYPHYNAWIIVQRRLLQNPPQTWLSLSQEWQIPYTVLILFWKNQCLPLLKEIARPFES